MLFTEVLCFGAYDVGYFVLSRPLLMFVILHYWTSVVL